MKLKSITFNSVWGQSGILGFFGKGDEYPHHKIYKLLFGLFGFSFRGMTFVAKTITLEPRIYPENSNTELRDGYRLKQWFPSSIWVSVKSFIKGYVLNAVGLANPGTSAMFAYGKWQERKVPFQLSVMPMAGSVEEKVREMEEFCAIVESQMVFHRFYHPYGIQVNFSCPNTGHDQKQDPSEIIAILKVFQEKLPQVPIIPKFDLLIDQEVIVQLKPYFDAFMIGNTLPFGKKMNSSWWKNLFPNGSPLLKHFGGKFSGGLSGKPLFPILVGWLQKMEELDPTVTIVAGGGITTKADITTLSEFQCVKAVALGSVAITRPWRMQGLINHGNKIFSQRKF